MSVKKTSAPEPTSPATTAVMKSNKGTNTRPEKEVRKILREMGYAGYRLNWKKVPGKPDIAYPGRKIAIFVNGCFWHRCPNCHPPLPKSHRDYWNNKFENNVERDKRIISSLQSMGWTVITLWECEIKDSVDDVKSRLLEVLDLH